MRDLIRGRRTLALYWTAVGLYVLVFGWWIVFFTRLGGRLIERADEVGAELMPEQAEAVRVAANQSMRMLLFEGGFVGLLLLASVWLVVRSLRREAQLLRQGRNFLSAVTHELKTPIASAGLQVESLLLDRVTGERRALYLERTKQDLDRLGRLVDQLLASAHLANGEPQLAPERLDLAAFVERTVAGLRDTDSVRGLAVEVEAPEEVYLDADPAALEIVLGNLLSNARKYGGDRPRARVEVSGGPGEAWLVVRDSGPGLNGTPPERVFEPFVRGEAEDVQTRPGVGLGLYMVAELARGMGGSAHAENGDPGGLVVTIRLPRTARAGGEER